MEALDLVQCPLQMHAAILIFRTVIVIQFPHPLLERPSKLLIAQRSALCLSLCLALRRIEMHLSIPYRARLERPIRPR